MTGDIVWRSVSNNYSTPVFYRLNTNVFKLPFDSRDIKTTQRGGNIVCLPSNSSWELARSRIHSLEAFLGSQSKTPHPLKPKASVRSSESVS